MYSPFKSPFNRVSKSSGCSASKKRNNLRIESLEDRSMMDAALAAVVAKPTAVAGLIDPIPLPSIVLSSNPGAPKTIYLDFNGNTEAKWASDGWKFSNTVTPAYDTDGVPSTFNFDERQVIREVWQRMAEDYAPFNVNVTTVDPGAATWANPNNTAMRVVFGGKQSDMHVDASSAQTQASWNALSNSGYSSIGSFTDAEPNTVYVYTASMTKWAKDGTYDWNGQKMTGHLPEYFANVGSHEVGHTMGLLHDNIYDGLGNVVDYYSPGSTTWTPMMGESISTDRTTWAFGQTGAVQVRSPFNYYQVMYAIPIYQDDVAILTARLGARPDDVGNSIPTAKALSVSPNSYVGTASYHADGIISTLTDADYYSFNVSLAGSVTVSTTTLAYGANLDSMIELYRSNGALVTSSDVLGRLDAGLTTYLTPGTYYAAVKSHGTYGDLGQYALDISTPKLAAKSMVYSTESLWLASGGVSSNTTTTTPKAASVASPLVSSAKSGGGSAATAPMMVAADSFFAEFETKSSKSGNARFDFDMFAPTTVNSKLGKVLA